MAVEVNDLDPDEDGNAPPDPSDQDLIREALDNWDDTNAREEKMRAEYNRCQRFLALDQWPENAATDRGSQPTLTMDQLNPIVAQIVNDWRRNRLGIKIAPADQAGDEGTALMISGRIKNIEYLSRAHVAYDQAFDNMVGGNRGFIGAITKRLPGSMKQELAIRYWPDSNCIYFDPYAKEVDNSDVNVVDVRDQMSVKSFIARFGPGHDTDFSGWGSDFTNWVAADGKGAVVAEHWKLILKPRKIQLLNKPIRIIRDGQPLETDTVWSNEWKPRQYQGVSVVVQDGIRQEDDDPERKVMQYIMTAKEILDRTRWLGSVIPIVPMWGRERWVKGVRYLFGAISGVLDAQVSLNFAESLVAGELGTTSHTEWIGAVGQFKSQWQAWQASNVKRFNTLEYDLITVGDKMAPPPQRQNHEPQIMAAVTAAQRQQENIRLGTGMNKSSLGIGDSKAVSGIAKKTEIAEGDNATFNYPDNGSRALDTLGNICVEVDGKLHSGPELLQIMTPDDKQQTVLVNAKMGDPGMPKDQKQEYWLNRGKYQVRVGASPSHQTMREERQQFLTEIYTESSDQAKSIILPKMVAGMDFEGARELADELTPPELRKGPDGEPPMPPEAAQKLQQATQENQILKDELQKLTFEKAAKTQELEARKEMNAENNLTKLEIAEQSTRLGFLEQELQTIKHQLELKAGMAAQEHAGAMATMDQDHQRTMQEGAQGHQQQLQAGQQGYDAQQAQLQREAQAQSEAQAREDALRQQNQGAE